MRYNESHDDKADGIVITPSHNPPDNGGIKYNATNGGPADTLITKWIETRANEYVHAYCELEGFKRISVDNIEPDQQVPYDYKGSICGRAIFLSSIWRLFQSAGQAKVLVNASRRQWARVTGGPLKSGIILTWISSMMSTIQRLAL
ncbi:MAG: hypothetical protein ACLUPK_09035 [Veillonella sp.]